ncbi:NRP1-like protein [Mya arenaria]|uniref:NRP1-like protein n=1 Tax=Mya arenaria TaxID=6604 RepID=A0ABY7FVT2_MYAAR|nr:NRP1-like protein [Mya arenaria]
MLYVISTPGVGTTFLTSSNTSWSQAQEMCSEEGGTMLTDDTYIELSKEDLAAEMDAANVTEAWIGRYYTPWSWLKDLCFNNSTLWNGTISTSRSGKTCLSWNSSGIEFFDGGVDNTDNFCRDPNNTGNTWCHTRRGPEACDIPKCLGTTDNNGAYACMAFKEISGSRIQAQQTNCSWPYKAVCKYPGGIGYSVDKSPWNQGRNFCRNAELISDGTPMYSMEDTSYILPDDGNYYWVGYRRTVRTVSDLNASFLDCFRLTRNENGISLTVEKCTEGIRAVCQRMPITCGETYNEGKRGKFSFPNTTRTYDSNHNCVWKIMATPPEKIEIYIEFDLEDSVIYDNDSPKGQANKTLCGHGNFTFISSGPAVVIQFISDESVNGTGFNASWKVEKEEPTTIRSITTVFNTQSSHTGFEEATTVFDTPTSHTGLKVWLIVVISSGSVVFVLLVIVLICCWSNEIITTCDKRHGSPLTTDSNRLDKIMETYETVPSELLSADSTQPQRAAFISPNDDFTHDAYNSLNATLNNTFASQTDNVYNHITKDETEYSVSVGFKTPTKTQIKCSDNVYNTLHKTEEKLYDHADVSGKPDKRTENPSDETYNQPARTTDNEYDSTCSHTRVADDCEYNYISK